MKSSVTLPKNKQAFAHALQNAYRALKSGQRLEARHWAEKAAALDANREEPWLVLGAIANPRASVEYLKKALEINPDNQQARAGYQWAVKRLHESRTAAPTAPTARPTPPARPAPAVPVPPRSRETKPQAVSADSWLRRRVWAPLIELFSQRWVYGMILLAAGIFVGSYAVWWQAGNSLTAAISQPAAELTAAPDLQATQAAQTTVTQPAPTPTSQTAGSPPGDDAADPQQDTPEDSAAGSWRFDAPNEIAYGPFVLSDGSIYLVSATGVIYGLNADGSPRSEIASDDFIELDDPFFYESPFDVFDDGSVVIVAPERVYALNPDGSLHWEFPAFTEIPEGTPRFNGIEPGRVPLPERTELATLYFDTANVLHAYTIEDGLLWEYPFDAPLREAFLFTAIGAEGEIIITDKNGTVRAFAPLDGTLLWEHRLEAGKYAVTEAVFGPDGNLYYLVTNKAEGAVQALSPQGQPLWRVDLDTYNFFQPLIFSADGRLIFVEDDIVDTQTVTLLELAIPFDIEQFIAGEDDGLYFQSGNNVIHWQIGPEGFELLNTMSFSSEDSMYAFGGQIRVSASQIIELRYYQANSMMVAWFNMEGVNLGMHHGRHINVADSEGISTTTCERQHDESGEDILTCLKYLPGNAEPFWEASFGGIEGLIDFSDLLFYDNGRLYLLADGMTLYVFVIEIPHYEPVE